MNTAPQYSRMPGRSGLLIRNSLWKGEDHLLSVRGNPFSESYRRYYFADIQAIVLTELPDLLAPYGYLAVALLIVTAAALVYTRHPVWGGLCALLSIVAFFVSRQGANCVCQIQTSVSTERLPSLRRREDAGKTVALLKTEIERTQGSVSAEALEARPPHVRAGRMVAAPPALRHRSGLVHWLAFSMMLVRGALTAISLAGVVSTPLSVLAGAIGSLILLLLILAAIQQRHSDLAKGVRRLVYAILAFYVSSGIASIAISFYIILQLGPKATSQALIAANPALRIYEMADLIGFWLLGCAGMILMWRHHRAVRTPPPVALGDGA